MQIVSGVSDLGTEPTSTTAAMHATRMRALKAALAMAKALMARVKASPELKAAPAKRTGNKKAQYNPLGPTGCLPYLPLIRGSSVNWPHACSGPGCLLTHPKSLFFGLLDSHRQR